MTNKAARFACGILCLAVLTARVQAVEPALPSVKDLLPEPEVSALKSLYENANGSDWDNRTNWLNLDAGFWYGVTISGEKLDQAGNVVKKGHVTEVILKNNHLVGNIPDSLTNLSYLEILDLSSNRLAGEIPPTLGNLVRLEHLSLRGNALFGAIPSTFAGLVNLRTLCLADNQFSGQIPSSIGDLPNLELLDLSSNNLTGTLFSALVNGSPLRTILAGDNAYDLSENSGFSRNVFILQSRGIEVEAAPPAGSPRPLASRSISVAKTVSTAVINPPGSFSLRGTTVIDFNGPPVQPASSFYAMNQYDELGFHVQPLGELRTRPPYQMGRVGRNTSGYSDNGTAYLNLAYGDSMIVTTGSYTAFDAISVEVAEYSKLFSYPQTATFVGRKADGSTVTASFTTDGVNDGTGPLIDFETFYFPSSFSGLQSIETTDSIALDNLNVSGNSVITNPTPTPTPSATPTPVPSPTPAPVPGEVTVNFNGPPFQAPNTSYAIQQYNEQGFHFQPSGAIDPTPPYRMALVGADLDKRPNNGTPHLVSYASFINITPTYFASFNAVSVEIAEYSTVFSSSQTATFIGRKADGSFVSVSFSTDGIIDGTGSIVDFETFFFPPSFQDLVSLEASGQVAWDNLTMFGISPISPTPTPTPSPTPNPTPTPVVTPAPTPLPPTTRLVSLAGKLSFGSQKLRSRTRHTLTIKNSGNSPLHIAGIRLPAGFTGKYAGTLQAGQSKNFAVIFSPTEKKTYKGNLTINCNSTGGIRSRTLSGKGY